MAPSIADCITTTRTTLRTSAFASARALAGARIRGRAITNELRMTDEMIYGHRRGCPPAPARCTCHDARWEFVWADEQTEWKMTPEQVAHVVHARKSEFTADTVEAAVRLGFVQPIPTMFDEQFDPEAMTRCFHCKRTHANAAEPCDAPRFCNCGHKAGSVMCSSCGGEIIETYERKSTR